MRSASAPAFAWSSPLGLSVALFLACSFVMGAIALLSTVLLRIYADRAPHFVFSAAVDGAVIGANPADFGREYPGMRDLLFAWSNLAMGFLLAAALLQAAVAWYSLRAGQPWALWVLTGTHLVTLIFYWLIVVRPFAGQTQIGLADLHPFALVPTLLFPIAFVLGLIAVYSPGGGM